MLTAEDIKQFQDFGYCVAPVVFDAAQIRQARQAVDRVYAGDLDDGRSWPFMEPVTRDGPHDVGTTGPYDVRTTLFSAYVNRTLRSVAANEALVDMAAALLGCEALRLWQDQAIWKPGTDGLLVDDGNIGFHQDYSYWQDSSTTNMVSANIALQDVTAENGALRMIPGSHKLGLLSDVGAFFDRNLNETRQRLQADLGVREDVPIELKAGQVSFHHSLTIHCSGPNTSASRRLVLAPAYIADGTFYRNEGQPFCPHGLLLGDDRQHGTPFAGEFFPLLRQ